MGAAYVRAYLDRLLLEDALLGRLHPDGVRRLLAAVSPDHRALLVNLYQPVAAGALGVTLAEESLFTLDITAAGQRRAAERLSSLPPRERRELLRRAGEILGRRLELSPAAGDYLCQTAEELGPYVDTAVRSGCWQAIFPVLSGR